MRLLVSPSSLEEAARSLAADIIDVKRPAEGSLGANFPWVIRAIRDLTDKPVSAAIGDFDFRPGCAALAAYGAACAGADYIKVGLRFSGEDRARELIQAVVRAVKVEFPEKAVVIAAYADHARLSTISPMAMAPLAAECGADVAMIDTGIKDGKRLFDYLDEEALTEFTAGNLRLGLETALAGSLRFDDIPRLKRIGPEIIGVRGMVCGGDRSSTIRADLVEKARVSGGVKEMYTEKMRMETAITFDDVLLEPAASEIEPDQADVRSRFSRNIPLSIPLVSAAMDTVTESVMAVTLAREGGIGVIHRNMPPEREEELVGNVKHAEDLIQRRVLSVGPDATVSDVNRLMNEHQISGVPVMEKGRIIGIVSRRDIRGIVQRKGSENIRRVMTRKPITATEEITMDEALETMYGHKVERLPVVDNKGTLLGIITMQDILEKHQYPRANRDAKGNLRVAAAVGPFDFDRAARLADAGADAIVVDCAHGHNLKVVRAVKELRESLPCDLLAGNIATRRAAEDLAPHVDGLKVGIGPGSICTTRIVAGVGVPQISAIADVAEVAREQEVPVIADGGIRYSGDIAKALAAGADSVMIGSLFAGTDESPGRLIIMKGRRYKQYRGMGSLGVMSGGESADRYFQKKDIGRTKFVPEGVEGVIPYAGPVADVAYQLIGGLKSAMGYTGCRTIRELHEKTRFRRITPAGYSESHPHNILITDEAPNYRLME